MLNSLIDFFEQNPDEIMILLMNADLQVYEDWRVYADEHFRQGGINSAPKLIYSIYVSLLMILNGKNILNKDGSPINVNRDNINFMLYGDDLSLDRASNMLNHIHNKLDEEDKKNVLI